MNALSFIRDVIYNLKLEYGLTVDIYSIISSTDDLETGVKITVKAKYTISLAILLPKNLKRIPLVDVQGQPFNYGGFLDQSERLIILDSQDYPSTYIFKLGDYCIAGNQRFQIKSVETYDDSFAVVLKVEETKGQSLEQIFEQSINQRLRLTSISSATL